MEKLILLRLTTAVIATALVILAKLPSANIGINVTEDKLDNDKILLASNFSNWRLFDFQPHKR